jgi:pimeloyl-ACP methyl ester carboxylesterase
MGDLILPDCSLHFQSQGTGETIVLIHGLGANHAFWFMGIARRLAHRYRVITYDLRGHGRSSMPGRGYHLTRMSEDLDAILSHLGVPKAHLIGHSFGARVALHYTISHPERVATVTIADTQLRSVQPPVRLREWPHWPRWRSELLEQGHDEAQLPDENEIVSFKLLSRFNNIDRGFTRGSLARASAPSLRRRDMGRRGAARWERLMSNELAQRELDDERPLSTSALRTIHIPALGVYGEYSHCLPSGQQLTTLLPDYRLLIVPGVGHFHPAVKPRALLRILSVFLRRHAMQQSSQDTVMSNG